LKTKELVKKCIRGDAKAQKELYDTFAPKMLSLCHRYAKSTFDAKDIFQEGFLKVFENLKKLKDENALEWWMKKIFVNEALKLYNKNKMTSLVDYTKSVRYHQLDDFNVFSKMETDEITAIIRQLPDKMRLVFNMYVIEGFQHHEIAQLLDISVGTSKSNLHDARKTLQNKIKKTRLLG